MPKVSNLEYIYTSWQGVKNWLLLRVTCGTKRLNPFFRLHEASVVQ